MSDLKIPPGRVTPWHQTNWDWRAACNFIGGGTGTGLLFFSTLAAGNADNYRIMALVALALIGGGLTCVWLEIGRPFRAINVFFHPQTSWMTREGIVAVPVFLCGLAAVWFGGGVFVGMAALLGVLFLYCQGRILQASKGIPAWREPKAHGRHDETTGCLLLEKTRPVSKFTLLIFQLAQPLFFEVVDQNRINGLTDFLTVGAYVLNGCGADPARNPGQTLDAAPTPIDGVLHKSVPLFTGLNFDQNLPGGLLKN